MKPKQDLLNDLLHDCIEGSSKVFISRGAMETAKSDFNLRTQDAVLDFIGNGGLERPRRISRKRWENNPDPDEPIMVDDYEFYSGSLCGYIAFFYQPKTEKWIIKSFKKDWNLDSKRRLS